MVTGIVQGVGFRPYLWRLAHSLRLCGAVWNQTSGVVVEVEGAAAAAAEFVARIRMEAPPLAIIESLSVADIPVQDSSRFSILPSVAAAGAFTCVPPDTAVCPECLGELSDPGDRRFGYPFINCTNCGPRYSIIRAVPYDRPLTTMAEFPMCPACEAEYKDPGDRRLDAQPNACPVCGPWLSFLDSAGRPEPRQPAAQVLARIRALLGAGSILAIKGLGGFHLCCDASNASAVALLRDRKRRSAKPFALMARDLAAIEALASVSSAERAALLSPRKPIVLLSPHSPAPLPPSVAPGGNLLGFFLPYTPLHALLFAQAPAEAPPPPVLVMTSGNLSEEPIVSGNEEAFERLAPIADAIVVHNRPIETRLDDSVVRVFEGRERLVRRARGYAPAPIALHTPAAELLACGADLKNAFCLTRGRHAILSQHIGDLENLETLRFFEETLEHMKRFFGLTPSAAAHDLHPGYLSTRYAREMSGLPPIPVQHHHAHIASCMADNGLDGSVLGVAFDGTGFGADDNLWGGEILGCDYSGFTRAAHLRYIVQSGGDTSVRKPWRMALSYLDDAFDGAPPLESLPLSSSFAPGDVSIALRMIRRRLNSVLSSSAGRLFDAVASLCGLRQAVTYEGQAAIELEAAAADGIDEAYPWDLGPPSPRVIDLRPTIRAIAADLAAGTPVPVVSARFHNTVASLTASVCRTLAGETGLKRVCLSGGTFQNHYLLTRAGAALRRSGLEVFLHSRVPANDGGLALGQALIASTRL